MVLGCLCVDFWLWSFASERRLDMKQIFRVIMCLALFAGLPAFADVDKGIEAYKKRDYKTALREWRPLAEQGNKWAQNNLGAMYHDGLGVAQDYQQSVKWHTLSAKQGVAAAQNHLGQMYVNGLGLPKDYQEGVKWFRLSAEQGFSDAQSNLGIMYANGWSVPKDNELAYMWANLGASNGDNDGVELRDDIEKEMTPEQIENAQKLSRECLAKNYKGC